MYDLYFISLVAFFHRWDVVSLTLLQVFNFQGHLGLAALCGFPTCWRSCGQPKMYILVAFRHRWDVVSLTLLHICVHFSKPFRACCMVWVSHLLKILWQPLDVHVCSWLVYFWYILLPWHYSISILFSQPLGLAAWMGFPPLKIFWRPLDVWSWFVYVGDILSPWHYSVSILFSQPLGLAAWCGFPTHEHLVATSRCMFLVPFRDRMLSSWHCSISVFFQGHLVLAAWCGFPTCWRSCFHP